MAQGEGSRLRSVLGRGFPGRLEVRQDPSIPWARTKVHFGGRWRWADSKQVNGVLWKRGAGRKRLRLIVLRPIPYRLSPHSRTYYRLPAYVLTTDIQSPIRGLVQTVLDRWQIEVNHRDEKDLLGVGQAQVRSPRSIPRHPAFAVASYSLLLLAALRQFGPGRTNDFLPLPKWRKKSKRHSFLDILTLLRKEIHETLDSSPCPSIIPKNLILYADT